MIDEHSLVEICELLAADRFELVLTTVTFFKALPRGDGMSWTGELGDSLVQAGDFWCIFPAGSAQPGCASVA